MLQSVEGGADLFFFIVATLYAAELIWRERDTHFAGIHDALPIAETTDWFSKLFALCFVELVLLTVAGLCGILMQTVAGYYHYELAAVRQGAVPRHLPAGAHLRPARALHPDRRFATSSSATALSSASSSSCPSCFSFGWENTLYLFGNTPPYTYSDMNGYGHFVPALFWSITYWLSISCVLGVHLDRAGPPRRRRRLARRVSASPRSALRA